MNEIDRKVKNLGTGITILSALIIFANFSGGLNAHFFWSEDTSTDQTPITASEFNPLEFLFENYIWLCAFMVSIGIIYLIGGLLLRKQKELGRKWVIVVSIALIVIIWLLMIALAVSLPKEVSFFSLFAILNAVIWSLPLFFLVRYLNKLKKRGIPFY